MRGHCKSSVIYNHYQIVAIIIYFCTSVKFDAGEGNWRREGRLLGICAFIVYSILYDSIQVNRLL